MTSVFDKLDWKQERPLYLVLAIVGLIITTISYFIPRNSGQIKFSSLAHIDNQVLLNDPKIEKRKGGEKILLQIKGHDKLIQISGFDFSQTIKRNILNSVHSGDTIGLKTDSAEFKSFDRETFFDKFVEIHSLTKNGIEYLNIDRTNSKISHDMKIGIPLGLYLMAAGLIYWCFKTGPKISPTIVIGIGALILIFMLRQ